MAERSWIWKQGIAGGIFAGIIFAIAEMLTSLFTQGSLWGPLQMIAGIVIAQPPAQISLANAIIVGLLVHLVISSILGIVIAWAVSGMKERTAGKLAMTGAAFGFAFWLINFYVIGPAIGAGYFATQTNPFWQFLWHTFAFGAVMGLYLAGSVPTYRRTRARHASAH